MAFPATRMRRLRRTRAIRDLVRENDVGPANLIAPYFIVPGTGKREPIGSMPGVDRLSVDLMAQEAIELQELGLAGVLLFGLPEEKDEVGSSAWDPDGPVQLAVRAIKAAAPELTVVTDVCMCEYTSHGHCGVIGASGDVDNDETLDLLARTAISHAAAGADAVAPSDMMDGRVGALRAALDEEDFTGTAIIAYSAKFASAFYGPFRDAADSAPQPDGHIKEDRRGYQMDPANAREAVREAVLDVEEGADIVMVKPGLPYLDIVRQVRDAVPTPVAVYNVSGEYSMVKAAAASGYLDERSAVAESLLSMRRAGADIIFTYHAKEFAQWQKQ
ncbi:MAG: porphobilinogen synthase [Thermoleophilaceae bacterium]|nr:porphobilinogen synthase [Thermoleophilaceae bacterium]